LTTELVAFLAELDKLGGKYNFKEENLQGAEERVAQMARTVFGKKEPVAEAAAPEPEAKPAKSTKAT
jgi:phage gp16-like protein